jgi:hypothetical protein
MVKNVEVYNLAMSTFLISLACSHAVFNTSSLFMSISSLIWLHNIDMKSILTFIQTEPLEEAIDSG